MRSLRRVAWRQASFLVCLEQLIGRKGPHHKEEKMTIAQEFIFVGIDVSKNDFVVHIDDDDSVCAFANTEKGYADLIARLAPRKKNIRIALEPTGGYEWPLWRALAEAGFHVRQICAAHIKAFRDSRGRRAKTDRIDAMAISSYLAANPDAGRALPSEIIQKIKTLAAKRRQLVDMRKALLCQQKQHTDKDVLSLDAKLMNMLDRQIKTLDQNIRKRLNSDDTMRERAELLSSFIGVGPVVATTLIAEMPELGALDGGAAASLAGLAPVTRESGQFKGKSFIRGGRENVRSMLYLAAQFATRKDPFFKTFADRLKAKGKPYKVIITAVARKLIEAINLVLKRRTKWEITAK